MVAIEQRLEKDKSMEVFIDMNGELVKLGDYENFSVSCHMPYIPYTVASYRCLGAPIEPYKPTKPKRQKTRRLMPYFPPSRRFILEQVIELNKRKAQAEMDRYEADLLEYEKSMAEYRVKKEMFDIEQGKTVKEKVNGFPFPPTADISFSVLANTANDSVYKFLLEEVFYKRNKVQLFFYGKRERVSCLVYIISLDYECCADGLLNIVITGTGDKEDFRYFEKENIENDTSATAA